MKTYWLVGKKEIKEQDLSKCPFISIMEEEVRSRNRDEKIDSSNSRLNMDAGYPVSSSPLPYSPVSFKDVLEERNSPGGRKISAASVDGEGNRAGANRFPRGSKDLPPGCPFAMGLFGDLPSGDSAPKDSEKQSPGKKNFDKGSPVKKKSPDIPHVSAEKNSSAITSKLPAIAVTQSQSTLKTSNPQPTSKNERNANNNKIIKTSPTLKDIIIAQSVTSSKPPVIDLKTHFPVKHLTDVIHPSQPVTQNNHTQQPKAIDSSFRTTLNNSVPSKDKSTSYLKIHPSQCYTEYHFFLILAIFSFVICIS
ncbi:unnamed protein product [Candidula unifasciata]|uniref:Uncharacterized protein n=1 Tax=Candidula unifasciata TaxID=100452 RepID=A0A8S3ZSV2_9EUPU|nr:unnamed protein product [Candidula unifasciata]